MISFDRPCEGSGTAPEDLLDELAALRASVTAGRATNIGFPGATDIDYSPIVPFFTTLLNNVGDPWTDPAGAAHTKRYEREVIAWFADLFGAPPEDQWGYVTSGGTEGNLYALYLARTRFPDGLVYHSRAAHYSVAKAVHLLQMDSRIVGTTEGDEMNYDELAALLGENRHRPAIVVANCGTTMTEAADDLRRIRRILDHATPHSHLHADAALTGVPLALTNCGALRLDSTMDSISVSGHKFLGTPIPCGVVLTRHTLHRALSHAIEYTATLDTTVTGSRCGQAALLLWYAIRRFGRDGLHRRAEAGRELAAYAVHRLNAAGWPAWRHPHALTVVFPSPGPELTAAWVLATSGGRSHLICMPGVTRQAIDQFIEDVAAAEELSPPIPRRKDLRSLVFQIGGPTASTIEPKATR